MASEAGVETLSLRHGVRCVPESGVTVEEVLLAVGEQVGCENIYSASRMNKAVVVFLVMESCVSRLTESGIWVKGNMVQVSPLSAPATRIIVSNVPPFIKNEVLLKELAWFGKFASDMKMIPLGCKSSAVRHVLSFRRRMFMFLNNRHQSLEVSFRCKHGDGSYIVFASSERLRCFECGDIGHKQFGCPHKAAQQVHLDTDQADTQGGRQGVSGLTAESNASAAGSEGHDQHTELVPSGAAEASTSSGRKAKAKTDRTVREEDEQVIEHLGVIDSSAHEEHVEPLLGLIRKRVKGVSIQGSPCVSVSAYADDVSVFVSNRVDVQELEDCLQTYSAASSAKVNWEAVRKNWECALTQILEKLAKWTWLLSQVSDRGRVLIINNLAASTLWHRLAVLNAPPGLLAEIQRRLVAFFLSALAKGSCIVLAYPRGRARPHRSGEQSGSL
ncbi:hypothetical protein AOLI_G00270550 [Acnodon oligacanthus]